MKKEEIIKGLQLCAEKERHRTFCYCNCCPFEGSTDCAERLLTAAATLLDNSTDPIEAEGVLCATLFEPALRPCLVNGKKAYFHRWSEHSEIVPPSLLKGGHCGGQVQTTVGIFENEDGTMFEALPTCVQFLDRTEREAPRHEDHGKA